MVKRYEEGSALRVPHAAAQWQALSRCDRMLANLRVASMQTTAFPCVRFPGMLALVTWIA